jgi:SAM-dependent methyltransferase
MPETQDVREVVREKYGEIAEGRSSGCCETDTGCGCGCSDPAGAALQIGYSKDELAAIPEGADLGLGCGNPLSFANAQPGETVLDLGSGAGIDCFLAARAVGPAGKVIGVDMTAEMIQKARANATKGGYTNVEFRLGEIEHLPVADGSVDLTISNCVVNLSPEKSKVFGEVFRTLKPGGRMLVSDLVLTRELSAEQRNNVQLYVGCVAGAALQDEYLQLIRDAGFQNVEIMNESGYEVGIDGLAEGSSERDAFRVVRSIKVRAVKPA